MERKGEEWVRVVALGKRGALGERSTAVGEGDVTLSSRLRGPELEGEGITPASSADTCVNLNFLFHCIGVDAIPTILRQPAHLGVCEVGVLRRECVTSTSSSSSLLTTTEVRQVDLRN